MDRVSVVLSLQLPRQVLAVFSFSLIALVGCGGDGTSADALAFPDAGDLAEAAALDAVSSADLDAELKMDSGDGGACTEVYTSPGCGLGTRPDCYQYTGGDLPPAVGVYYCSCAGKTVMGSVIGVGEPYQFKGCCPGDSGFGPLWAYSCSIDGGIPFLTPKDAGPDAPSID